MEPTPPDSRPPITARQLSWHQAMAGIEAREAAQAAGGDRHQLRALIHAAGKTENREPRTENLLKGLPLRADDLLVTLCFGLHKQAFGHDPRSHWAHEDAALRMRAIATLGFLFTQAEEAYKLLDLATDADASEQMRKSARQAFRDTVAAFAADFQAAEIQILTTHLLTLAGFTPAAEDEEAASSAAGEPLPPSPPEPSWWQAPARLAAGLWRILKRSWPSIRSVLAWPSASHLLPVSPSSKPVPPASTPARASATSTAPSSPPGTPPPAAS